MNDKRTAAAADAAWEWNIVRSHLCRGVVRFGVGLASINAVDSRLFAARPPLDDESERAGRMSPMPPFQVESRPADRVDSNQPDKQPISHDFRPGPVPTPADQRLRDARRTQSGVASRTVVVRGPYVSRQVNVNGMGGNIPGDAANEPSMAIDPTDPNRIVIGWRQFDTINSNFRQAGWAYSSDGGLTWTFPGVITPGTFRSDPILEATSAGVFFYNTLQSNFDIDVFRSDDGGVTWPNSTPAFGGDKAWMAIDRSGGTGDGHIYINWSTVGCCGPSIFTRSTDGGASYETPIAPPLVAVFGTVDVGPDGEVYLFGIDVPGLPNSDFVILRSSDALNPAVTPTFDLAQFVNMGGAMEGFGGPNPGGLNGQAWVAINPSTGPDRGHVYALCSVDPPGPDPMDVHFIRSTDGGQTWSAPLRVNDEPLGANAWQWFGTMSVAPNGRIDVVWNDTRGDPTATFSELYYAFSCNGGLNWTRPVPVSPAFNSLIGWPQQNKIGDYYDMTSDDGGASLAWSATFNGEQDVYFLRIPFDNDCNTNGTPDETDIAMGASLTCNGDCRPIECRLADNDCNTNGSPDDCDIAAAASFDCRMDGTPDECQLAGNDCNTNSTPDDCDLAAAASADCQLDGTPDECQLAGNDCNSNGVPDECETDCNSSGVPDACELAANDCNTNLQIDSCEVTIGFANGGAEPVAPGLLSDGVGGLDNYVRTGGGGDAPAAAEDFATPARVVLYDVAFEAIECLDPGMPFDGFVRLSVYRESGGGPAPRPVFERLLPASKTRVASFPGDPAVLDVFRYTLTQPAGLTLPSAGTWWISVQPRTATATGFSRLATSQDQFEVIGDQGHWRTNPDAGWVRSINVPVIGASAPTISGYAVALSLRLNDCNTNGLPDACDGLADANGDSVPDACQDCNTNGAADPTEGLADCNSNGMPDVCDVAAGDAQDCDTNGVADSCEADCDGDGTPDSCEAPGDDCNTNGLPDVCETADCNTNGTPDSCDGLADCNTNGTPDRCDLNPIGVLLIDQLSISGNAAAEAASDDELLNTNGAPFAPNRLQSIADDFQVPGGGWSVTGAVFHGAFADIRTNGQNECQFQLQPGDPGAAADSFTIRFWSNNALNNIPQSITSTQQASAAQGRVARVETRLGTRYYCRFASPVALAAGRRWVEIFYDGPSGGDFNLGFSRNAGNLSRFRYVLSFSPVQWRNPLTDHRPALALLTQSAIADANTNNVPDECDAAAPMCGGLPGDLTGDGFVRGDDIACFVQCYVSGATGSCGGGCGCADVDQDGDRDECDRCLFVQLLLNLPAAACSPGSCP